MESRLKSKYSKNRELSIRNTNILIALILAFLLQACALSPAERTHKLASKWGFTRQIIQGVGFRHVVYLANRAGAGKTLHVYLEGDGVPWVSRQKISMDPTSRSPVMLSLMAMDDKPAVYLGRPCYLGLSDDPGCNASLWTFRRYSQQVIDSMVEVIRHIIVRDGYTSVKIFGHSGGGTLAMLMAQNLPETQVVVTLAGNLDVQAWTKYHDYTPLYGSLDPAKEAPLDPAIYQVHLRGGQDEVVPPSLAEKWLAKQTNTDACLYQKFNHRCCWANIWPKVLVQISLARKRGGCVDD